MDCFYYIIDRAPEIPVFTIVGKSNLFDFAPFASGRIITLREIISRPFAKMNFQGRDRSPSGPNENGHLGEAPLRLSAEITFGNRYKEPEKPP